MSLLDMVTAPAIGAYWTQAGSNRVPYLGETLFPARKKLGLDLSWIKGYNGLPVALKPSNFDAKAELRDRIGVSKKETEMPFFREGMLLKEEDRQDLSRFQESNPALYESFMANLYNDRAQLIEGALVQSERMRMSLLRGGVIDISAGGVVYTYNYDDTGEYAANNITELTGTAMWTDHDKSTPVSDLIAAMSAQEDKYGAIITRAVLTRATWSHLLQNKSIKMDMNVLQGDKITLTDTMLRQYLESKLGLQFAVYNKKFRDESGVTKSFFADGYVSLLPDGDLGNTWYGTTPEETDLMGKVNSSAQVAVVETGIAVTTFTESHPVNVNTIVAQAVLPSFERMNETYLLKVF